MTNKYRFFLLALLILFQVHAKGQYCASYATSTADGRVHKVDFSGNTSSISQLSSNTCQTYTDNTALSADITVGSSYSLEIKQGSCGADNMRYVNAWIDYNGDGDFADAGEQLATTELSDAGKNTVHTINFTVPSTAVNGVTRLRIVLSETSGVSACGTYLNGETEDYTVVIDGAPDPMVYSANVLSQNNTDNLTAGSTNQEILGLKITTQYSDSPLELTSLVINNNGTTDIADISNIYIYYTGLSSTFGTTILFGTASSSLSVINISGNQTLQEGDNYFWIAYDISSSAAIGDLFDAELRAFTLSGVAYTSVSPTSAPAGSRMVSNDIYMPTTGSSTVTTCNGTFYDDGGASNDYSLNISNSTLTFYPSTAGSKVQLDFSSFATESGYDFLSLYDGGSTAATAIFTNEDGSTIPTGNPFTSTATDGSLTVKFYSDNMITAAGWQAAVSCYTPVAMIFDAIEVLQTNTSKLSQDADNQEVLQIVVTTIGSLNPLDLTRLTVKMDGTTDLADVDNVDIYYTGSHASFSTLTLFGSASVVSGDIDINGTQALSEGSNYFWLVYDINSAATIGNVADGECVSVVIDGTTQSTGTGSIAGSRTIASACDHEIHIYDFAGDGWDGGSVDVVVNGVTVLSGLTLVGFDNYASYSFQAGGGDVIETIVHSANSEMEYFICNADEGFVLADGQQSSVPTGTSGAGVCGFDSEFVLNGSAYHSVPNSFDDIVLTPDIRNMNASVWYKYRLDLTQDFEIEFDLNFGNHNSLSGGDGIVFVMQDQCANTVGVGGGNIGWGSMGPAIGIEFDTYYALSNYDSDYSISVEYDHAAIFKNGSADHSSADALTSAVKLAQDGGAFVGLTDHADHRARVSWDATTHTLNMYWEGSVTPTLTYTGDIVTDIFSGTSEVYWGFTSASGWATNEHKVKMITYPANTTKLEDVTIDLGNAIQLFTAEAQTSYTWLPNDASIDNNAIHNPTLSPSTTQTYTVTICDPCGIYIEDEVTVTVAGVLPVELVRYEAECYAVGSIKIEWATLSETNNDYFTLERSVDAFHFEEVVRIPGKGNRNDYSTYDYIDRHNVPHTTQLYYRLSQTDFDGSSEVFYSLAVHANCDKEAEITIFPNPASDYITIELNPIADEYLIIKNAKGKVVYSNSVAGIDDVTLSLDSYQSGMYFVYLYGGRTNKTGKFIVF